MGCVSPIGNTVDEFAKSIVDGKNGIDRITRFDVSDYKHTLAFEVKNFDPAARLDKNVIRKSDLFTIYALYAADEAVEMSGILGNIDPEELGVYVGSGIG